MLLGTQSRLVSARSNNVDHTEIVRRTKISLSEMNSIQKFYRMCLVYNPCIPKSREDDVRLKKENNKSCLYNSVAVRVTPTQKLLLLTNELLYKHYSNLLTITNSKLLITKDSIPEGTENFGQTIVGYRGRAKVRHAGKYLI